MTAAPHDLEELDMTDETDGSAYSSGPSGSTRETGPIGPILDAVDGWLSRFIRTTTPEDIHLLTLWAGVSTCLCKRGGHR